MLDQIKKELEAIIHIAYPETSISLKYLSESESGIAISCYFYNDIVVEHLVPDYRDMKEVAVEIMEAFRNQGGYTNQ